MKTEIHVELHVAMIQSKTGIIGDEIDFDALPARHVDRVLENSCRRFFADPSQLKCMPVKVNRVIIAAFILHRDTITLSLFYRQRIDIRPGFPVNGLAIESAVTAENFFKH